MQIGLLLPHFGRHAITSRLINGAAEAERLGFDSLWVRDHIVYRPHTFEDEDTTFLEAFTVLGAVAACTSRVSLGTATMIPFRHPVHSAMLIASLARLAHPERLLIGWGIGNDPREFSAAGAPGEKRGERLEEHVAVVRALLAGRAVTHHGTHYSLDDVRVTPVAVDVEFWYGGGSPRGVERAAAHFDGLLASRIPRSMLSERIGYLAELSQRLGMPPLPVGVVTLVSPAATLERGLAAFDLERIRAETERRFPGRSWTAGSGLDGVVLAGPAQEIAAELVRFSQIGVTHVVLDLRARFDVWEEMVTLLGGDVLPLLRRQQQ